MDVFRQKVDLFATAESHIFLVTQRNIGNLGYENKAAQCLLYLLVGLTNNW